MRRWQRLGVDPGTAKGGYDVLVENTKEMLSDLRDYPNIPHDWDREVAIAGLISDHTIVGILGHLQYPHPFGAEVSAYGIRAAEIAIDYFEGDWRDEYVYLSDNGPRKLTREQCRKKLDWIETYREGLMWSLCFDLEEPLQRLLAWPGTDLPFDDGTFRLTKEDNKYHVILARCLRGESLSKNSRLVSGIQESSRIRPKRLLEILEKVLLGDTPGFAKKFAQWVNAFRKQEFNAQQIWLVFSIEATILWHVARRYGLELPEQPLELLDLIVRQETLVP
ncbi:MAG: hypothetical protein KDA57_18770 [Planctomycetales bacterium]|nr:hypothetical protein [Planctomycetales bacterium]